MYIRHNIKCIIGLSYDTGPKTYYIDLILTDSPDMFGYTESTSTTIIIIVDDVADQDPLWVEPCYPKPIDEMIEIDTIIYTIKAIDLDSGINSNISYKILDNSTMPDKFRLEQDKTDGSRINVIVNGEIDIEDDVLQTSPIINLNIQAEEEVGCNEDHCYRAVTPCMLQIQDINDNVPTFNSPTFSAAVKENVNIGEILSFQSENGLDPRVDDKDLTFNKMSISFEDETMSDYFNINPRTVVLGGDITISSKVSNNALLDADTGISTLDIVVVARDDDKPEEFFNKATFTITIIDVNDLDPYFEQDQYEVNVKEDLSDLNESKELVKVSADDDDKSSYYGKESLRYKFVPGSELQGLSINEITGVVTVDDPQTFDYEQEDVHNLEIEARDCGGADICDPQSHFDRTKLIIHVENVNDNPPKLTGSCEAEFYNTLFDEEIIQLVASDADVNDSVTFSMDQSPSSPFSIVNFGNSEGAVKVNKSAMIEVEDTFNIDIVLTDDGSPPKSITAGCTIIVKDVNDNKPKFTTPELGRRYWIKDDLEPNQPMTFFNGSPLRVAATDGDVNTCYNTINYAFRSSIDQDYRGFFSLNQVSGLMTLLKNINDSRWENDNGVPNLITLPLLANDDSGPGCEGIPNEAARELLLKVFTNYEPKFNQEQESHVFNETVIGQTLISLLPSHTFQVDYLADVDVDDDYIVDDANDYDDYMLDISPFS